MTQPLRTIGTAIELASPGDEIAVAPGLYPPVQDSTAREGPPIVVRSEGGATVEGLSLNGAQGLTFEGLTIVGAATARSAVVVTDHPTLKLSQVAKGISLVDDDISGSSYCVEIRDAASNITLRNSHVHDCMTGVAGPGNPPTQPCEDIVIAHNVIEEFTGDVIQFGNWNNVTITENRLGEAHDPEGIYHDDDIQMTGNVSGVRIVRNLLHEALPHHGQMILLQPAFGPIEDVLIENNLLYGLSSGGHPVQSQGVPRVSFRYNTIWAPEWASSVLLRAYDGVFATDTEVVGNILGSIQEYEGARSAWRDYNLVATRAWSDFGEESHGVSGAPEFRDPLKGDFHLRSTSPAWGAGDPTSFPTLDLEGRRRQAAPSMGALESATR